MSPLRRANRPTLRIVPCRLLVAWVCEAKDFALVSPVKWKILDAYQLVGCQLGRLPPFDDRLDDIGAQVGDSKHARKIRGIDAVCGSKV